MNIYKYMYTIYIYINVCIYVCIGIQVHIKKTKKNPLFHVFFGPLSFGMVRLSIQVAACWLCVRSVKSVSSPPLHANPGKIEDAELDTPQTI